MLLARRVPCRSCAVMNSWAQFLLMAVGARPATMMVRTGLAMKDALRLNVSAVSISIFVGTAHEKDSLLNLAKLVDEGEDDVVGA